MNHHHHHVLCTGKENPIQKQTPILHSLIFSKGHKEHERQVDNQE
jgi:hypothetical protein